MQSMINNALKLAAIWCVFFISTSCVLITQVQTDIVPAVTDTPKWASSLQLPSRTPFLPEPTQTEQPIDRLPTDPQHTPTLTSQPSTTPTVVWVNVSEGEVAVPILLYHQIADSNPQNRYYVSPDVFLEQMKLLKKWGYTTITISYLVEVIQHGGRLPRRPIVITFDDGNLNIYQNAFQIMKKMGFVGVVYVISSQINSSSHLNGKHLKKLFSEGWEIGSHSQYHLVLPANHAQVRNEILQSRLDLEKALGKPIRSFAYPFGLTDEYISRKVMEFGYLNAVGLGVSSEHSTSTLYYLSRREVEGSFDLEEFASLLPWTDPVSPKPPDEVEK